MDLLDIWKIIHSEIMIQIQDWEALKSPQPS